MTVAEVIEELQKMPQDATVVTERLYQGQSFLVGWDYTVSTERASALSRKPYPDNEYEYDKNGSIEIVQI